MNTWFSWLFTVAFLSRRRDSLKKVFSIIHPSSLIRSMRSIDVSISTIDSVFTQFNDIYSMVVCCCAGCNQACCMAAWSVGYSVGSRGAGASSPPTQGMNFKKGCMFGICHVCKGGATNSFVTRYVVGRLRHSSHACVPYGSYAGQRHVSVSECTTQSLILDHALQ